VGVQPPQSHLWARDNPHAIRKRGYQVRFSVSVWAGISWDIVLGPYLLPDRLTANLYRDFLENVLPGLLEDVPLAVRQKLWFQHDGTPAHFGEDVRQWLNATYPGRWIRCGGPIAWRPQSPDLTSMAPRAVEVLVARLQAAVTTVDANRLRHVRDNAVRRTGLPLNGRRPLRTPIVTTRRPWFYHLIACAIWRWRDVYFFDK
jgi:hypothetical protein